MDDSIKCYRSNKMIDYFLATLWAKNPDVIPKFLIQTLIKGKLTLPAVIILSHSYSYVGGMLPMHGSNTL
jgi:hypothetical protein